MRAWIVLAVALLSVAASQSDGEGKSDAVSAPSNPRSSGVQDNDLSAVMAARQASENATGDNSTGVRMAWRLGYSAVVMVVGCVTAALGFALVLYAALARTDEHWIATATVWGRGALVGGGIACFAFGGVFFFTGVL